MPSEMWKYCYSVYRKLLLTWRLLRLTSPLCTSIYLSNWFIVCRLHRYWLKGKKAGTTEIFAVTPGVPDNVRTNANGEFWVGLHCHVSLYSYVLGLHPRLRTFILRLPIPLKYHYMLYCGRPHGIVVKYNADGEMVEILEDKHGKAVKAVSEVEEKDGKLWMGSVMMPFMAVF